MADPTKLMQLLEIAKKFGVKPSKVIGTQGNIVPFKKPSLVDISVDEFKLKESIDKGTLTMDKVQQEMEETVRLALSKNLNDVELNRALNNAVNIERQFFPPVADVIAAGSGKQVTGKGLEEIIEKGGLMAPPNTPLGKADFQIKRAKQSMEDIKNESDIGNLIKGAGRDQLAQMRLHNEGLVRAVTRQILSEDIKAGKIKSLTLDDLGTSREPIDYFRKIYGENALEQLDSLIPDFNRLNTEQEAANLARSKFKFEPDEFRLKGSTSYEDVEKAKTTEKEKSFFERLFGSKKQEKEPAEVLDITAEGNKRKSVDELIDEYNANQDRTRLLDERGENAISYEEFQDIQKKNEDIAKELEKKGVKSTPEPEEVKEEGIVIPFRKKFPKPEPEGKAQGGIIGYAMGGRTGYAEGTPMAGLVYVGSWEGPWTGPEFLGGPRKGQYYNAPGSSLTAVIDKNIPRSDLYKYSTPIQLPKESSPTTTSDSVPLTVQERYNKYLSASGSGTGDELYKSYRANLDKKADGGRIGYAKGKKVMSSIDKLLEDMNKKLSKKKSMESVNPKTGEVTVPKKPIRKAEEPTGVTIMDQEPIDAVEGLRNKHKDAFEAHDQIFNVDINDKIAPDMIAESMAETKGKDYFSLSQKEQSDLYKKALAYVDDVRMTKKQNKPIEGGFDFNDSEIKAQMEKAMQEGNKRSKEMRAMGLDPAKSKDYDEYIKIKEESGDKNFNKYFDDLEIKTKFKGVISDDLLNQILIDNNPQRKAEVIATIEQGLTMQEKGMSPEEIVNILKNTTRTKQADGGIAGLL